LLFNLLHLIFYEVPHCDFHHIDGDLQLVSQSIRLTWASDYLMEVFGLGSVTSPWLDDYVCWFGGLLTCVFFVDHPLVTYLMFMEHVISLCCGFGALVYLRCATSYSWIMVLDPHEAR
jgi:hypothetical protein